MVGVAIVEVVNTLLPWLYWIAGSYAGRLGTNMTSFRSARLNTLVLQYLGMSTALSVF
jgi:hypothetical protein